MRWNALRPALFQRAWFRLVRRQQPEALEWIREQRDQYPAGPGPYVSIRTIFGPVCTGFFAYGVRDEPHR